jgi:hypothetical protein
MNTLQMFTASSSVSVLWLFGPGGLMTRTEGACCVGLPQLVESGGHVE